MACHVQFGAFAAPVRSRRGSQVAPPVLAAGGKHPARGASCQNLSLAAVLQISVQQKVEDSGFAVKNRAGIAHGVFAVRRHQKGPAEGFAPVGADAGQNMDGAVIAQPAQPAFAEDDDPIARQGDCRRNAIAGIAAFFGDKQRLFFHKASRLCQ